MNVLRYLLLVIDPKHAELRICSTTVVTSYLPRLGKRACQSKIQSNVPLNEIHLFSCRSKEYSGEHVSIREQIFSYISPIKHLRKVLTHPSLLWIGIDG